MTTYLHSSKTSTRANLWGERYQIVDGTPSARVPSERMIPDHSSQEELKAEIPRLGSMASHQMLVLVGQGSQC